jgi:hypothetical protein
MRASNFCSTRKRPISLLNGGQAGLNGDFALKIATAVGEM